MGKIKTGGFNFQDLEKDNSELLSNFDIENGSNMEKKLKSKKKKINFGKLFTAPKNNENMGMDNISNSKPFEGLF